jgi:chromosomal replication initiator protein
MKASQIWQAALGELQLELHPANYDTWFNDARLLAYEDGTFLIGVQNAYVRDWLEDQLSATIQRVLTRLASKTVAVRFVSWEQPDRQPTPPALFVAPETVQSERAPACALNPRYTLESFVVGGSNRLAHAAATAVIEHPADSYNPFFIYGGTGLGKTHLLHAIGNACHGRNLRTLFVQAETFTNDLVEAIRTSSTEAFRETYRTADVLLIDDIQFIAGKEATQEEFFHTFNALHSGGAQIVISSDRRPRAMAMLEERLRSRFEWGLMVDVRPPDLETRIAILQSKSQAKGAALPGEALYLIAERIQTNIRELEGALNKVLMLCNVAGTPPTAHLVEAALVDLAAARPEVDADQIIHVVAHYYGVERAGLEGPSRKQGIARPRQVAMYLMRQETDLSLSETGQTLGGRDHSTVLHACNRISALADEDDATRRDLLELRERLYRHTPAKVASRRQR